MGYVRNILNGEWTGLNIDNGKIQIDMPSDPAHAGVSDPHESYWINLQDWLESNIDTFLELTDTPSNYTDDQFKLVRVNATEDALEFIDPALLFASLVENATEKTALVGNDRVPIWDSEEAGIYKLKYIKSSNLNVGTSGTSNQTNIKYGRLYNWFAASDANIAPVGYHVPTKTELDTLVTYLGGSGVAGGKLKELGVSHWLTPNTGADNSTGFKGLPGGFRSVTGVYAPYNELKQTAIFWSVTDAGSGAAYDLTLAYNNDNTVVGGDTQLYGFSIKLIKDNDTWEQGQVIEDYDGNVYNTVKIGNQVWTVENFACTHLNDGTTIPRIEDAEAWGELTTPAYCEYDDDIKNVYIEIDPVHLRWLETNHYYDEDRPGQIYDSNDKITIADADVFLAEDSESNPSLYQKIRVTFATFKSQLKAYFDDIYTIAANLLSFKTYHGIEAIGTITENNTDHTITVASVTFWYKGTKYTTASPVVCDLDLTADRDNSSGTLTARTLYYFYFKDATGKLYWSDAGWNFKEHVFVCTAFWNGSALAVQNEFHSHTRDIDWHLWAHDTIGMRYESGSFKTYPSVATPASLQIETGTYHDEDLDFTTGQLTTMRGWNLYDSTHYTFADYALPYVGTSGQPQYLDTDTYALTNVGANDYVNMWVYVSNDKDRKCYIIPTHAATAYNTLALARAATTPITIGLNINADFKLIYKFIYKGDGSFIESVDYRSSSPVPGGGTGVITAGAVSSIATDNIISTNVQSDKAEIDRKTLGYTSTASAAGTTVMDVNSNRTQRLTGILTHTHQLPVTSTLTLGRLHHFINDSTGLWTLKASNTTSTIITINPDEDAYLICIDLSATDETAWKAILANGDLLFAASDEITALSNGTSKITGHWPFNAKVTSMFFGLSTVSSSGSVIIDFNDKDGNTIFSTRPTALATYDTSLLGGSTQPVFVTTSFAKGDKWTVDIDSSGTGAKGLKVYVLGKRY